MVARLLVALLLATLLVAPVRAQDGPSDDGSTESETSTKGSSAACANVYFPVAAGNSWTYVDSAGNTYDVVIIDVTGNQFTSASGQNSVLYTCTAEGDCDS